MFEFSCEKCSREIMLDGVLYEVAPVVRLTADAIELVGVDVICRVIRSEGPEIPRHGTTERVALNKALWKATSPRIEDEMREDMEVRYGDMYDAMYADAKAGV